MMAVRHTSNQWAACFSVEENPRFRVVNKLASQCIDYLPLTFDIVHDVLPQCDLLFLFVASAFVFVEFHDFRSDKFNSRANRTHRNGPLWDLIHPSEYCPPGDAK